MIAAATLSIDQKPTYSDQHSGTESAKPAEQWAAEVCAVASQGDAPDTAQQQPRDLCAQFRAAAAAERSAVFDQEQARIGWLTFAGLIATIFIAMQAWREAKRSADADNRALNLTRKQLRIARNADRAARFVAKRQSRAYVHVIDAWIDMTEEAGPLGMAILGEEVEPGTRIFFPKLFLKIENVGQTATTFLAHVTTVLQEPIGDTVRVKALEGDQIQHAISNLAPQSDRTIEAHPSGLREKILAHRARPQTTHRTGIFGRMPDNFCVRGRIRYIDVFGDAFTTEFGFYGSNPRDGTIQELTPMSAQFAVYREDSPPKPPAIIGPASKPPNK